MKSLTYWIGEDVSRDGREAIDHLVGKLRAGGVELVQAPTPQALIATSQAFVGVDDLIGGQRYSCDVTLIAEDQPEGLTGDVLWLQPIDVEVANPRWRAFIERVGRRIQDYALFERVEKSDLLGGQLAEAAAQIGSVTLRDDEIDRLVDRRKDLLLESAGDDLSAMLEADSWSPEAGSSILAAMDAITKAKTAEETAREQLGQQFGQHTHPDDLTRQWGRLSWGTKGAVNRIEFEGETNGVNPHGYGVMKWPNAKMPQSYTGHFVDGVRCGFGEGRQGQIRWKGGWRDDQPNGPGGLFSAVGQGGLIAQGRVALRLEDGAFNWSMLDRAKSIFRSRKSVDGQLS